MTAHIRQTLSPIGGVGQLRLVDVGRCFQFGNTHGSTLGETNELNIAESQDNGKHKPLNGVAEMVALIQRQRLRERAIGRSGALLRATEAEKPAEARRASATEWHRH